MFQIAESHSPTGSHEVDGAPRAAKRGAYEKERRPSYGRVAKIGYSHFAKAAVSLIAVLLMFAVGCKKAANPTPAASEDFLALLNVGKSQYEKGDAATAITSFEKAVQRQPTSVDARLDLANAYLAAGQPEKVFAQTQQVLGMEPQSGAAHYLAGCAYLRLGKFQDALKDLQQAKDIDKTVNEVSFQLGIAYEGLKDYDDAITQWRETVEFGPEHPAAYYRLSQALARKGETTAAEKMLEKHREVTAGKSIPGDPSFFEQCRYTQILVPFVLAQPDAQGIDVKYSDVTKAWLPDSHQYGGPAGLIDIQRLGQPGLLVIEDGKQFRLLTFTNNHFEAIGNSVSAKPDGGYAKVLVGDLDNDRYEDAIVLGTNTSHVLKMGADGRMIDRTLLTGLAQLKAADGALADLDFTSKLSLVAALPDGQGLRFYANLGNVMFKENTVSLGLPTNSFSVSELSASDVNKDNLPDLLAVSNGHVRVFENQRGGTFVETNAPVSIAGTKFELVRDFNNDLRPDMALLADQQLVVAFGGLTNRTTVDLAGGKFSRLASLDFDNDGWLDIAAVGESGIRVWRNEGERGLVDVTAQLQLGNEPCRDLLVADLNDDCATDLVAMLADGSLKIYRNEGGNQNHMVKIKAVGNRSNASGIGTRFEFNAGNWRGMRTVYQTPLEVGVGKRKQIDSAFVQWTQLRMNVENIKADECRVSFVTEIEQKQMTSCPYLYAWDGKTFRFVSDFLSAAPLGLPSAPGKIIAADPEELLWLGDEQIFPPKDGKYVLQMTEELSEMLYLDEVKLVAVDHPAGTEVFSKSKMLSGPPWLPHTIVTVQHRIPLIKALCNTAQVPTVVQNADGELFDVTDRLRRIDDVRVSPEIYGDQLRGWAKEQEIILDFGLLDVARPLVLELNGWLRFGGGMANIAASQRTDLPYPFPRLFAETADNQWTPVNVQVGTPAGRTKSIIVDLTGKLPPGCRRLKLTHAFEIHWDEIALYEKAGEDQTSIARLAPAQTDLRYRGFSEDKQLDWTHPTTPMHDRLHTIPLVPNVPQGWTTRFGPVDELVATKDNALALINGGDALTVSFDASMLPTKPEGYVRDFFVWSVGWDKDTDYYTQTGDQIDPLPWHGMDDQDYGRQPRPTFGSDKLMEQTRTRWVSPRVPSQPELARH